MKKIILFLFLASSLNLKAQTKIGGVTMPGTFKVDETSLILNGAGIREKYWIDLYVGGLYIKAKNNDAAKIMAANEESSIRLHIISGMITSDKMKESIDEGFKKSTKGNITPIKSSIDQFKLAYKDEIKKGDVFDITYTPEMGTVVYKNTKALTTIKGLEFKKALWGIWLCDDPADADLKAKMLGK